VLLFRVRERLLPHPLEVLVRADVVQVVAERA
jgi:hypothetical protein